jgi:uncharacterized protein (UPF0147 family)
VKKRSREEEMNVAKMTIHVDALNLDKVKQVFQVIKDVTDDDRVAVSVREEIKDKLFAIMDSDEEC